MLKPISWLWDNDAAAYVDKTFTTGYDILDDVNDVWYLGFDRRFISLYFVLATGGVYTGLTIAYWDGNDWREFGLDYTLDANGFVRWSIRDVSEWVRYAFDETIPHANTPPDTRDRYWLKVSCSAITTAANITSIEVVPFAHYATPQMVSEFLQQVPGFSTMTQPSEQIVETFIHRHESAIDRRTKKSWKMNYKREEREFNYAGVKLTQAPIRSIIKVRLWQGISYRTLLAGRQAEFYPLDDLGMIYFTRMFVPLFVPYSGGGAVMPYVYLYMLRHPLEITYLYGYDFETHEEAGMIEDCTIKMTAITVLQEFEQSILTKAGVDRVEMSARLRMWREEVDKDLMSLERGLVAW